jgi:hypothetical protein
MKAKQACKEKDLIGGTCDQVRTAEKIAAYELALRASLANKCSTFSGSAFTDRLQYPGKCGDPDPTNAFTLLDLQNCMATSHELAVDKLFAIQYNTNSTLDTATFYCQRELAKDARRYIGAKLEAIQKCRNDLEKGKLTGILGSDCASETKTAARIAKAESRLRAGIQSRCNDTMIQTIGICSNPDCAASCGTCTEVCAENCILATHGKEADDSALDFSDLIDFEYATAPICGDQAIDQLAEECDGTDDSNCPGQCGSPNFPDSFFACLCMNKPRERVIEHKESDLDNGWKGDSHDSGTVEGGGYVVNLFDCDGPGGPDTLCTVGPTCTGGAHAHCYKDSDCGANGPCRRDRTATGPYCLLDPSTPCPNGLPDCPGFGNTCVRTLHGPPLPLAAGSIQVCILNIFSEDVVGTKDVATGSAAVRIRQKSVTHLTSLSPPCPVCGGFCTGPVADRHICTNPGHGDCADVSPTSTCNLAHVCSSGDNQDKACRADPPFGGPTDIFGTTSNDCPPAANSDISQGGLDILFNPATTGSTSLDPSVQCSEPVFSGKTCALGSNNGAVCTVASQCPGGSCSFQCFCPNVGGAVRQQPNQCQAACVGGANDAASCNDNSECPSGFCHLADCRIDGKRCVGGANNSAVCTDDTECPGGSCTFRIPSDALLQPNEGGCTVTFEGHCNPTKYRTCSSDLECTPAGGCALCTPSDFCNVAPKNCFLNSRITRTGVVSPTDPTSASVFCIAGTGTGSVDGTAGLPGPGALLQPTSVIDVGPGF